MVDDCHEFGGEHTEIKLRALRDYLPAYTQALKRQRFRLTYIVSARIEF